MGETKQATQGDQGNEGNCWLLSQATKLTETAARISDRAQDAIFKARTKQRWSEKKVRTKNTHVLLEDAADRAANHLASLLAEMEECTTSIQEGMGEALSFIEATLAYHNKLHEGTCLGEAGKEMLENMRAGTLTLDLQQELLNEAVEISKQTGIPFCKNQEKTQWEKIQNFIEEEKGERVDPIVHRVMSLRSLSRQCAGWHQLLEALVQEDCQKAEKIIAEMG